MASEDSDLPRVTFATPQSSHAGWVSTSWLYPMSALSYTTPSVSKLTFPGLPYRLQSSLVLAATSLLQYNPNFGHFKPILMCKSDTWKASGLYPHSMCSLARKGSAGVLLCHSLAVTSVSHLPLCNASCRKIGRGGRKDSAGNQCHLLFAFQKLQTQSWWAMLCS